MSFFNIRRILSMLATLCKKDRSMSHVTTPNLVQLNMPHLQLLMSGPGQAADAKKMIRHLLPEYLPYSGSTSGGQLPRKSWEEKLNGAQAEPHTVTQLPDIAAATWSS